MSGANRGDAAPTCPYRWCVTEHGRTLHPDDEDHRSIGVAIPLEVRRTGDPATVRTVIVEVGLYRRRTDDETWLVFDDGVDVRWDVTVGSARAVLTALEGEVAVRNEMWPRRE